MQRAMARQAEAERERRAKVINAEGEFQAAGAARPGRRRDQPQPGNDPAALPADARARSADSQNSTIVFPLPIDMVKPLIEASTTKPAPEQEPAPEPAALGDGGEEAVPTEQKEPAAPAELPAREPSPMEIPTTIQRG